MRSVRAVIGGRETVTVAPLASVLEAAQLMAARRIGAVPVVDGDRLAGIFTERDVLTRVVAAGLDPSTTTVADVMSIQLVVAEIGEPYDACLQRMRQARVRHLIVLNRSRCSTRTCITFPRTFTSRLIRNSHAWGPHAQTRSRRSARVYPEQNVAKGRPPVSAFEPSVDERQVTTCGASHLARPQCCGRGRGQALERRL
ncbi:MAG: hypothetical protein DMG00_20045 [Acidobacteria bacterium]|nr:MAG: hypothetical protein DMG00_20045 [Acidobacteriota bacterium]